MGNGGRIAGVGAVLAAAYALGVSGAPGPWLWQLVAAVVGS